MSAAELRAAFSFLPPIHTLLTTLQYSADPSQHAQHTAALLAHLSAAHSLLETLPAVKVSSVEQQAEYARLCEVRDRKRQLLRRYNIDGAESTQQLGAVEAEVKRKTEVVSDGGAAAMELGT